MKEISIMRRLDIRNINTERFNLLSKKATPSPLERAGKSAGTFYVRTQSNQDREDDKV